MGSRQAIKEGVCDCSGRYMPGWWFPLAMVEEAEALCLLLSKQHNDSMFLCWYPSLRRVWAGHYGPKGSYGESIDNCYARGACVTDDALVVEKVKQYTKARSTKQSRRKP